MENKNSNKGLVIAIFFATVVVAGSAIFLGLSLKKSQAAVIADLGIEGQDDQYNTYVAYARKMQETITEVLPSEYEAVNKDDIIRGNKDAAVTILEYSDFECPYCKRFHPNAKTVVETSNGNVNWVYRHFPLSFHDPEATNAALATECVRDLINGETAFEYTDIVFERGPKLDQAALTNAATDLDVDEAKFTTCYETQEFLEVVEADKAQAPRSYINGTPGLIMINNKTGEAIRIAAALEVDQLEDMIQQLQENDQTVTTTE